MGVIVVTGADGFIGAAVVRALAERGLHVRGAVRDAGVSVPGAGAVVVTGDLAGQPRWAPIVGGAEVVVHLAAKAHQRDSGDRGALEEYRRVNCGATLALAEAAVRGGVRRLVFLSSIGVLGERTGDHPFRASDLVHPEAAYAISKAEAEERLMELAARTGLEVVIIRPPLVCGPGAPGNLRRLLRLSASPWPLPFGGIRNRRTFVGLANLVDLIVTSLDHHEAPGAPLLAGDDEAVTVAELVTWMRQAMDRPARLLRIPGSSLRLASRWVGLGGAFEKLAGSLEVDNSATKRRLGWRPKVPTGESIARMARHFVTGIE